MKTCYRAILFVLSVALTHVSASDIPDGLLGLPLGTYLEVEGLRAEKGKVGVNTLIVNSLQGRSLPKPIGIWIDNVEALPKGTTVVLRGYESGKMIGFTHEVAKKENIQLPQARWQFFRYFIVTSVVSPSEIKIKSKVEQGAAANP